MKLIKEALARIANACLRVLPATPPATNDRGGPSTAHAALMSPWRVYRLYARPDRLLLRDEQGKILDFGVMSGVEPHLAYRLFARGLTGRNFASSTVLLEDIARRIEAGEISREMLELAECTVGPDVDLDRGTHTDVSMKLAR